MCYPPGFNFTTYCKNTLGGIQNGARCFFIANQSTSWDAAWDVCASYGGTLAQIHTTNEYKAITVDWPVSPVRYFQIPSTRPFFFRTCSHSCIRCSLRLSTTQRSVEMTVTLAVHILIGIPTPQRTIQTFPGQIHGSGSAMAMTALIWMGTALT